MLVTVAICTWNRASLLNRTLEQLRSLRIPRDIAWELLVVDNNCTDHTAKVIDTHSHLLPLRRLFEPMLGQSHARNSAIREARGELLLWTDDDVLVDHEWLEQYVRAFADHTNVSFAGGTIIPWFEETPPSWLIRNMGQFGKVLAVRELGELVRPLESREIFAGANMAFRTDRLREYAYDPKYCRTGESIAACEDHELVDRMRADGHTGLWVGTAKVKHFIPRERMMLSFARRWWRDQAKLYVRRFPAAIPSVNGVPRWLRRKHIEALLREWFYSPSKSAKWADAFFEAAWLRGLIDACAEYSSSSSREVKHSEGVSGEQL